MSRQLILRFAVGLIGGAIAMDVCALGGWLPLKVGYCFNITPSEPVGIYELVSGGASRGALVLIDQPHDSAASTLRRYIPAKLPLIKRVAALPGDSVRVESDGIYVNGVPWPDSVPLHDDEGRALHPYPFGVYRVAAGKVWVLSNHPRGLDSRYFGPVPAASVISRLEPLLTWTSAPLAQWLALAYTLCLAAFGVLAATATINALSAWVIGPCEVRQQ
ncbi:MAG TPA: conjugative transfer signal peptidase TraF [Candidatus Binataceae bacterium]|nr:conjugative transfer signal peptidase TraF [Candidatus Binataceae bacterium]